MACRCTILVEFAQLVLTSPHLIPPRFIDVILSNMNQFLSETHPSTITKYDEEQSCIWSTLLPYVKLFYQPDHQLLHRTAIISNSYPNFRALLDASINMSLFFLHSKVGRKCTCDILLKEGLLDYVTALPWYVDPRLQIRFPCQAPTSPTVQHCSGKTCKNSLWTGEGGAVSFAS